MKSQAALALISLSLLFGCKDNGDTVLEGNFEFISEYSTEVTVGGVVGVVERTFKVGEVYQGSDSGEETITIRIAKASELNNCPNSWCYQELLEVPRELLLFQN